MGRPEDCHCPCGYEPVLRRNPITIVITEQPKNATVYDDIAIFNISSTIDQLPSYYYQWQKRSFFEDYFTDIPFANGSTLLVSNPSIDDNGAKYRVYIGHYGNDPPVYSDEATLSITKDLPSPTISIKSHPKSIDLGFLDNTILSVDATVSPSVRLFYQWQISKNGFGNFQDIPNENQKTLSLKSLLYDRDNLNEYRVKIKTSYSPVYVYSNIARITLTRFPKISIISHPSDTQSNQGVANFNIEALADDGTPLSYVWQRKRLSDNSFITIPQSRSSSLVVRNLNNRDDDESLYRAILYVGNINRSKLSQYAKLSVPKSTITAINPNTFAPIAVSGEINLSVLATITSGDEIIYQWQNKSNEFDNVYTNISGANTPNLKLTGLEYDVDDNDIYRIFLQARYSKDVSTSQFFTINVPYAPKINVIDDTQLIFGISGNIGNDRSFTLFSTAELEFNTVTQVSGQLFGFWQSYNSSTNDWINIANQSGDYLSINNASYLQYNNTEFRRFYTSDQGSTPKFSSSFAVLLNKPTINVNPLPISFSGIDGVGEISVIASVNFNQMLSYQWQKFNPITSTYIDIPNTNSATLRLENLRYLDNNLDRYRVIVSATDGADSVASNFSTLLISKPLITFTKPLADQTALAHSALFSVEAAITNTSAPLSYQWQKLDKDINIYTNIIGEDKSFLSLSRLIRSRDNNSMYRVGIRGIDGAESVISEPKKLSVEIPAVSIINQPASSIKTRSSTLTLNTDATATYEGTVSYQWQEFNPNLNHSSFVDISGANSKTLTVSNIGYFTHNLTNYRAKIGTFEPETVNVFTNFSLLEITPVAFLSNLYQSYIIDQEKLVVYDTRFSNIYQSYLLDQVAFKLYDTRLSNVYQSYLLDQTPLILLDTRFSNMYQSYILDQTPAIFLDTRLSNIYQSYLLDQKAIKLVDTRFSNMYQSYALDQDILRFNFSGIPILSSGFISQKFINLYINSSQAAISGSQWEGYKVQLQNIVTNETKDLLVEQTGNYIVFNDDILLQDYNDYNVKIGFVYSQEQSPSPFTNYVNIPQLKPPSQVLNASIASPDDWELARTRLNLTWNTPLNSGSSSILGYQIKQSGFADSIRASGLSNIDTFINISGLIPGRSYIYDIRSFNLHGLSDPVFVSGNTSSIVKLSSDIFIASGQLDIISNAPINLTGSPNANRVSLSWTASNNIKGILSNYLVVYGLYGQQLQTVLTNSTNNLYTLEQLINNSTYYIKVAPVYYDYANVISTGDFSQTIFSTPVQPVEPIYLANGFISTLNINNINDAEFSNAAISNGFISVLTSDTINQNEFSNAALANGYLSIIFTDPTA
jgi:hypothetical protein